MHLHAIVMASSGDPVGDIVDAAAELPRPARSPPSASSFSMIVRKATRFLLLAAAKASKSMVSASEQAGRARAHDRPHPECR